MNRGAIRSIARDLIRQEDTDNTDFSDNELNNYIDEGCRLLATIVQYPRDEVDYQAQSNVGAFTVPEDYILLRSASFGDVSIGGDKSPLRTMTKEQLTAERPYWRDETSDNTGKPLRIIELDRNTLYIDPRPSAEESASGKKLTVEYVYSPAQMSNDTDVPELPIVYHDLIPEYVQSKCYNGKLNRPADGASIFKNMIDKAKTLEPVVASDLERKSMFWETRDDFENYTDGELFFK